MAAQGPRDAAWSCLSRYSLSTWVPSTAWCCAGILMDLPVSTQKDNDGILSTPAHSAHNVTLFGDRVFLLKQRVKMRTLGWAPNPT